MEFFVIFYCGFNGVLLLTFKYVSIYLTNSVTQSVHGGLRLVSVGKRPRIIRHRSRWDIMASVLSVATAGRTKTYVMRKCNLSYRQLQAYLDILRERGLLRAEFRKGKGNPGKIFVTTDRGRAFLKAYGSLRTTMEEGSLKFRLKKLEPRGTP